MRTKLTIKNGVVALIAYAINFLLNLYIRRLFLMKLDSNILGYDGTIGGVFTFLTISESGIGAAITYRLYNALANNSLLETEKLMNIYKYAYRVVALVIFVLSVIAYGFLGFIFDSRANWEAIRFIYSLTVVDIVAQYLLSTKRILFVANQKAYVCVMIDTFVAFVGAICRLVILIVIPNYKLYMIVTVLITLLSNSLITYLSYKEYPYVSKTAISIEDLREIQLFKDLKNYLAQSICYTVYGGVDNILAAKFLGVNYVTMSSNYKSIERNVTVVTEKMFSGLQSSIGNVVYSEQNERVYEVFEELDLLNNLYSCVVVNCFIFLFQPFISLWIGDSFLLPTSFVLLLSLKIYANYNQRVVTLFRGTRGGFEKDKPFMFAAAVVNLLLSWALVIRYGLAGLEFGTLVAALLIWLGRTKVVFVELFSRRQLMRYVRQQARYIIVLTTSVITIKLLLILFSAEDSLWIRTPLSIACPFLIFVLVFIRSNEFNRVNNKILMGIKRKLRES